MPTEILDGPGSKFDANMENLKGQDTRIPYGMRRSEMEAILGKELEGKPQMTMAELRAAVAAKPKKGKKK